MRSIPLLAASLLFLLASPAVAAEDALLFVSPMGEPFRGSDDATPETKWFEGADADRDGKLVLVEMLADAQRFFALLDLDKSGEIDPTENERYERMVVPEVGMRRSGGISAYAEMDGADSHSGGPRPQARYSGRQGAGLFSYIELPQPVMSADTSFNRGVSLAEFRQAAARRFRLLDPNGDGALVPDELPKIRRAKVKRKKG